METRAMRTENFMLFRDGVLLYRESGALPASALEELLKRVADIDMNEVRKKIAEAEATQPQALV